MESSAVVYCNSVLGARTNTEGRESTSAAMLTGKIPDWGFHRDEYPSCHAPDRGRNAGGERDGLGHARVFRRRRGGREYPCAARALSRPICCATSISAPPLHRRAESRCITWSASRLRRDAEMALGGQKPRSTIQYGGTSAAACMRRSTPKAAIPRWTTSCSGCPHASIEQIREAARLLDGKNDQGHASVDIHFARGQRTMADMSRVTKNDSRRRRRW